MMKFISSGTPAETFREVLGWMFQRKPINVTLMSKVFLGWRLEDHCTRVNIFRTTSTSLTFFFSPDPKRSF